MGEQQPFAAGGIEAHGAECRHAADETVHQGRYPQLGAGQVGTGQRRHLEATETAQGFLRAVTAFAMQGQGLFDHPDLVRHALAVQPGAGADQRVGGQLQQGTGQGTGSGGVADAHLAADIEVGAGGQGAFDTGAAGLQGDQALGGGHRRFTGEVRRTRPDLQVQHTGERFQRHGGTQVHQFQGGVQAARQHADGGPTPDEVAQHLAGHRLRVGGYALLHHAMVAGEHGEPGAIDARPFATLLGRQGNGEAFQLAEGATRLGQLVLAGLGLGSGDRVERLAGRLPPLQGHGVSPLRIMGRPATVKVTRSQRSARAWCSQPASST
ncbi:hypothetical protein D3C85_997640 [compost metagenome]